MCLGFVFQGGQKLYPRVYGGQNPAKGWGWGRFSCPKIFEVAPDFLVINYFLSWRGVHIQPLVRGQGGWITTSGSSRGLKVSAEGQGFRLQGVTSYPLGTCIPQTHTPEKNQNPVCHIFFLLIRDINIMKFLHKLVLFLPEIDMFLVKFVKNK